MNFTAAMFVNGISLFLAKIIVNTSIQMVLSIVNTAFDAAAFCWVIVMIFDLFIAVIRFGNPQKEENRFMLLYFCIFVYTYAGLSSLGYIVWQYSNIYSKFLFFFVQFPYSQGSAVSFIALLFMGYSIFKVIKPMDGEDHERMKRLKIQ